MPLTSVSISTSFQATETSSFEGTQIPFTPSVLRTIAFAIGDDVGEANAIGYLEASATGTLDFRAAKSGLSTTAPVVFDKIKAIYILTPTANTGTVTLARASSNAFVGPFKATGSSGEAYLTLAAGQIALFTASGAGWDLSASAKDMTCTITGTSSVQIWIVGVTSV